jgi:hypothetical protein
MRLFSKKPTESEARQALQDAIKAAIASAREAGLHPAVISNVLSGYSGEVMAPIYRGQERRQAP